MTAWDESGQLSRAAARALYPGAATVACLDSAAVGLSMRVHAAMTEVLSGHLQRGIAAAPWRDGDNVVVPAGEFPSTFYPWLQLRRRGVQVREIAMTPDGHATVADLRAALDSRTRVLAISAVQYISGYR